MDGQRLREVMRHYPQGVSVVTADSGNGPRGITISSFLSVSLSPPLVLVSISCESEAHPVLEGASTFSVNVLAEDQGKISEHFARSGLSSAEQFRACANRRSRRGSVWIENCLAYLDCDIVGAMTRADHTLFIGRVEESVLNRKEARPLVFYAGSYWAVGSVVHGRS
jgi:flavin reductase (DIM6/NTAB) family NADH-FMN oxidoreductase RutF